ncbi:hypothetical protein [Tropicimonas sediminicola]|uniref:Uncharacterized protein n=1 Tax=Tropicimonas sediminicola TaxID=1031541 RepID=A0A239L772_9RHOB|nr:hypothetical protein [Tropicimonas sediminicola]SNT26120.1 hypothetical protein SAMN05421757_1092 [Tropicimonas sediminicola]
MSIAAFWLIQAPGWLLFAYLAVAQCTAAVNYSLGVQMGTQEPADRITEVGVAFFKGYAGADLVFYTPVLGLGLIGHLIGSSWAGIALGAALGVTVYWPTACLWTVKAARGAAGWDLPKEEQYWIVLPLIAGWGALGLALLLLGK